MIRLVVQPDDSSLCGQCCIAMAAGVSLERATQAVGHSRTRGTYTREVIAALRSLGVGCAGRLRPVSRKLPVLPARAIVSINHSGRNPRRWHWMLTWDGKIYDPGNCWPDYYVGWRITSYLEIHT